MTVTEFEEMTDSVVINGRSFERKLIDFQTGRLYEKAPPELVGANGEIQWLTLAYVED